MPASQEYIDSIVATPRENLTIELKDWFDPDSPHGRAKIVRACLAMRNHNGGYLQIGFKNGDGAPNPGGAPEDVRAVFEADKIQALVSRFASEPFEVHVRFSERDRQEYPVLEVEPGLRSPVASKSEIPDPEDPAQKLIKKHAVYVRSLSASGVVGTTEAHHGDWPELTRKCFDNLEADVGRFVRRHLGGLNPSTARALVNALLDAGGPAPGASATPAGPPPDVRVYELLRYGHARFQEHQRRRDLTKMPPYGHWQVAVIVEGNVPGGPATKRFLDLISAANPDYTGWPLWLDSRAIASGPDDPDRPRTHERGWEAFMYAYGSDSAVNHLDFWRAEPAGRFYLYRGLEDDFEEGPGYPEAMTALDPGLAIWRTAEAIAVPLAFARAMGFPPDETTLRYLFSWAGLAGRRLLTWTNPKRFGSLGTGRLCQDREVESPAIAVPLDAPDTAVASFVRTATADLFAAFEGYEPGPGVTEGIAEQLLERGS